MRSLKNLSPLRIEAPEWHPILNSQELVKIKSEDENSEEAWKVQKKLSQKGIKVMNNKNHKHHNQCDVFSEDDEDEKDEDKECRCDITYEMRREIEEEDWIIRFLKDENDRLVQEKGYLESEIDEVKELKSKTMTLAKEREEEYLVTFDRLLLSNNMFNFICYVTNMENKHVKNTLDSQ